MKKIIDNSIKIFDPQLSVTRGFFTFVREQGVVGLAIGFILGGAVNKVVSSLVTDIIQPSIGLIFNSKEGELASMHFKTIMYGRFITGVIDFIILAAVVYFIFKGLGLDRLDKPKENK